MKIQHSRSVGFVGVSFTVVLRAARLTVGSSQKGCIPYFQANGDCDTTNNREACDKSGHSCDKSVLWPGESENDLIIEAYVCLVYVRVHNHLPFHFKVLPDKLFP